MGLVPAPIVSESEKWQGVPAYLWAKFIRVCIIIACALTLLALGACGGFYGGWVVWAPH